MISNDALLLAGATVTTILIPQIIMHRQNRRDLHAWLETFKVLLWEYPLHRHEEGGHIKYPSVPFLSANRKPNGQ